MRFPSFVILAQRVRDVMLRFPWTMAAGVVTAFAFIMASRSGNQDEWFRIGAVSALGLALSVALTLYAEEQSWSAGRKAALNTAGVLLLLGFYLVWPGPEQKHESIRYFQLSAGLHLLVATLPFALQPETQAFWQYNRHLFLGFLRALIFSAVIYSGLAIALVALDKLFGVDIPGLVYARLYLVVVFVINTGIFLAAIPLSLSQLASDREYPKVLKVFAQYVLTPLVFTYLIILLAYLVKIVAGGEWPSGWIGWLVTSVAVAGLLGFLLVHPLREDMSEAWIRTYTRWLFIGLIPAAVVLLVAFWKRVLPYGLTEPRLLGILLGLWLLAIAVSYTIHQDAGIRRIPVTLAVLLLVTLYGPLSVTTLSVQSQSRRLAQAVADHRQGQPTEPEASAALRFLLDHGAGKQIAAAIPGQLPPIPWDSVAKVRGNRIQLASQILDVAGMSYVDEYEMRGESYLYLSAREAFVVPLTGYDWMVNVSADDRAPRAAGNDTVRTEFDDSLDLLRISVGKDSLEFNLRALADSVAKDWHTAPGNVPAERLQLAVATPRRRANLAIQSLNGRRRGKTVDVERWYGKLFLGKPAAQ
jgi:Domain of unknown function (DUF4153)